MSFFKSFRRQSLSVEWEYEANGILWRLLPSGTGLFLGEDRSPERKDVSFFCLSQSTGAPLWRDKVFHEQWWIGLEDVSGQTVFLHEYTTPDMPEHKKIIAVDLQTGVVRWMNEELTFVIANDRFVYGKKNLFESTRMYELTIDDGRVVRQIEGGQFPDETTISHQHEEQVEFPLPGGMDNGMPHHLNDLLRHLGPGKGETTGIEYLEHGRFVVFGFYNLKAQRPDKTTMQHNLMIANRETRTVCFTDCLAAEASLPLPGLFYRIGDRIHYIKEKRILRSINLISESA